jgi:soluble lytic murein transglycosylase-like protein
MIESNAVEVNLERRGGQRRGALQSRSMLVRSFAMATRAAFEAVGFFSVAVALALAVSPSLRATVVQIGANAWSNLASEGDESVSDEVDSDPVEVPRIGQPVALGPANVNVATYLARRYHVADGAVRVMVAAALSAGKERQVDPLLILAVVAVESSMNPFAQSSVGATGLMQVMPDLHSGKFVDRDGNRGALDPVANIRVGSQILGELIRRGGSVERGLQLYVGAGNASDDGGYASRVLGELSHLRLAATGGVAAALANAMRSEAHGSGDAAQPVTSSLRAEPRAAGTQKPDPA